MKYLTLATILLLPVTSACAQEDDAQNDTPFMSTPTCTTYPEWTGQNVDDVDKEVLEGRSVRIIKPDSMVTMDYRPDRLNIKVDDDGIIITQECG